MTAPPGTQVSTLRSEDIKIRQDSITKLLTDVQLMKGKQESMDSKLLAMKHENEALWREVASLRQKHAQQQKVVNKLIQFLISLVQSNRILGVKRKIPLMLNDGSPAHPVPKYGWQYSLEHIHGPGSYPAASPAYSGSSLYTPDAVASSGPIISDITELAPGSPVASAGRSVDERPLSSSPLVRVKEEPPSPPQSPRAEGASPSRPSAMVETPLSPTTLIDSILRESEPTPAASTTPLADTGGRPASPLPASAPEKCLSVACLDKTELSDHLDAMDSNLDNLQTMLTTHGFSVDTSTLLDLFSPSVTVPDMSLPDLDSSLASVRRQGVGVVGLGGRGAGPNGNPYLAPSCCPSRSRSSSLPRSPPDLWRQRKAAQTQGSSWCTTPPSPCCCWTQALWTWGAATCRCSSSSGRAPTSPRETTTRMTPPSPC